MKRYTKQLLFLLLPVLILGLVGFGIWRTSDDVLPKTQSNILSALDAPELLELLELPGTTSGSGTNFVITDSDYINLTLDSTETIDLQLESIPEMITMTLEAHPTASTANITLSNLPPSTTFYKYEDNYRNLVMFTTDVVGSYTYTQDLAEPHFVFIQPRASTKFIVDDATGGDCTSIGIWNAGTKTCTLTTDVFESIQIDSDGITLDGNGYTVTGTDTGFGIFLSGRTGVTVADTTVTRFTTDILVFLSSNNTITGNNLIGAGINSRGVWLFRSDANVITFNEATGYFRGFDITGENNRVTRNFAKNNSYGIFVDGWLIGPIRGNIISNNTAEESGTFGIFVQTSTLTEVSGNTVTGDAGGMRLNNSTNSRFIGNTISGSMTIGGQNSLIEVRANTFSGGRGLAIFADVEDVQVYNNNFLGIGTNDPIVSSSSDNIVFNLAASIGGNYYDNFDEPTEGCNDINSDGFCDSPKIFFGGQDNLPWTVQDGWGVGPTQVTLTWDRNDDPDFESYRIYRSTNPGVDVGDELLETITNQPQIFFVDTTITSGQAYYYKVFVFDRAGLSIGGGEVSANP